VHTSDSKLQVSVTPPALAVEETKDEQSSTVKGVRNDFECIITNTDKLTNLIISHPTQERSLHDHLPTKHSQFLLQLQVYQFPPFHRRKEEPQAEIQSVVGMLIRLFVASVTANVENDTLYRSTKCFTMVTTLDRVLGPLAVYTTNPGSDGIQ
jgi:hypothetical protein